MPVGIGIVGVVGVRTKKNIIRRIGWFPTLPVIPAGPFAIVGVRGVGALGHKAGRVAALDRLVVLMFVKVLVSLNRLMRLKMYSGWSDLARRATRKLSGPNTEA